MKDYEPDTKLALDYFIYKAKKDHKVSDEQAKKLLTNALCRFGVMEEIEKMIGYIVKHEPDIMGD